MLILPFVSPDIPKIRLTGPPYREGAGIVQIYIHRQWGRICGDSWDFEAAQVVCRELGFPDVEDDTCCGMYFGEGSGPLLWNRVYCTGEERTLFHYKHAGISEYLCDDGAAGVICKLNKHYGKDSCVALMILYT